MPGNRSKRKFRDSLFGPVSPLAAEPSQVYGAPRERSCRRGLAGRRFGTGCCPVKGGRLAPKTWEKFTPPFSISAPSPITRVRPPPPVDLQRERDREQRRDDRIGLFTRCAGRTPAADRQRGRPIGEARHQVVEVEQRARPPDPAPADRTGHHPGKPHADAVARHRARSAGRAVRRGGR